jgi:hypothetical protein
MGKIITAGIFVILASTFAVTEEPGPERRAQSAPPFWRRARRLEL